MKLNVTLTSPYARTVRAAIIERNLQDHVDIVVAKTRQANSPYYDAVPSGRVPVLQLSDGRTLEESDLICAYLDGIGEAQPVTRARSLDDWEYGRLHAMARSYVDGIAVWGRELRRPREDQSDTVIAHETARAERMVQHWEREIEHPLMNGALTTAQILLYSGFDSAMSYCSVEATPDHPKLQAWRARLSQRPSLAQTKPPAGRPKPI